MADDTWAGATFNYNVVAPAPLRRHGSDLTAQDVAKKKQKVEELSPIRSPSPAEERRRGADGGAYTWKEFLEFFENMGFDGWRKVAETEWYRADTVEEEENLEGDKNKATTSDGDKVKLTDS